MALGKQTCLIEISSSCAILVLLIAVSIPGAQSSLEIDESAQYTHSQKVIAAAAVTLSEGAQGSSAADVSTFEGVTEVVPYDEPKPVADYRDCYKVCCWQGDPDCPYPYCNYNEIPCNGE